MKVSLLELLEQFQPLDATEQQHKTRSLNFINQTERCTQRSTLQGHITASAWILSPNQQSALLTHHKKLNRWLQLGGHVDDDDDSVQDAALREAHEESGISNLTLLHDKLFDIDVHPIPAKGDEPAHDHYDFRFLIQANTTEFEISDESHALAWLELSSISASIDNESITRMAKKALSLTK